MSDDRGQVVGSSAGLFSDICLPISDEANAPPIRSAVSGLVAHRVAPPFLSLAYARGQSAERALFGCGSPHPIAACRLRHASRRLRGVLCAQVAGRGPPWRSTAAFHARKKGPWLLGFLCVMWIKCGKSRKFEDAGRCTPRRSTAALSVRAKRL